ncbi:MAG: hypothetical protein FJX80_12730 [Bacteroidetes bacterium]|nr:hypothetical protein [Bacteroidota bacterium]
MATIVRTSTFILKYDLTMTTFIRNIINSCLFLMCMTPFVKVQAQTYNFGNGIDGIPSIGPKLQNCIQTQIII